jgi:ribosomal protein S18 acetylase RimI-like enzyme
MADSLSILAMAAALVQDFDKHQSSVAEFSIRQARSTDIPLLEYVERSAAEIFRTVGLGHLLDGATVDPNLLAFMAISNNLWVAVNRWDQPIGFAGGQHISGNFHLVELSVAKDAQGKGVGRALMSAMFEQVQREGYRAITLTTFRHLPWNGPWYARLGFVEVSPKEMGREYMEIVEHEAQNGLDIKQRCMMALRL